MSLRWKVILLVSAVFVLNMGVTLLVEQRVLYPSFVELEHAEAATNIRRSTEALQRELEHLGILCGDWGAWTDTYEYVQGRDPHYAEKNLIIETFTNNGLDLLCIYDSDSRLVWGEVHDPSTHEAVSVPPFCNREFDPQHPLVRFPEVDSEVKGVILTERGPMLIASHSIITGENQGPIRGAMMMGRFLNADRIAALRSRTQVNLNVWPLGDTASPTVPVEDQPALASLRAGQSMVLKDEKPENLYAYATIPDLWGSPTLLLRADVPKSITARGEAAIRFATISNVTAITAIMLLIWGLLERIVVRPLAQLMHHAVRVGQKDDLNARLAMQRRDEIGRLAGEFDHMVQRLAESRAKLMHVAHRAGMAEIATSVLHNVGNAINTVGISTEVLGDRLEKSRLANLGKAAAMLQEHQHDIAGFLHADDRGRKLVEYLPKLAAALATEQQQMTEDISALQSKVQHIKDVIAAQQAIAPGPRFMQDEDLGEIIREAVDLHAEFLARHGIELAVAVPPLPTIKTNRRKLVQVIENLIKNGAESIVEAAGPQRRLAIRARQTEDDEVCIEVCDTGVGIDPKNRSRIFASGFTTKVRGNGFGLHFCANAMTEMGGRIAVQSDGLGAGATFALRFPLDPARTVA
jgi:sensor domain CHASE-containing protein